MPHHHDLLIYVVVDDLDQIGGVVLNPFVAMLWLGRATMSP
jgi:hypothetical protein